MREDERKVGGVFICRPGARVGEGREVREYSVFASGSAQRLWV